MKKAIAVISALAIVLSCFVSCGKSQAQVADESRQAATSKAEDKGTPISQIPGSGRQWDADDGTYAGLSSELKKILTEAAGSIKDVKVTPVAFLGTRNNEGKEYAFMVKESPVPENGQDYHIIIASVKNGKASLVKDSEFNLSEFADKEGEAGDESDGGWVISGDYTSKIDDETRKNFDLAVADVGAENVKLIAVLGRCGSSTAVLVTIATDSGALQCGTCTIFTDSSDSPTVTNSRRIYLTDFE